MTVAIPESTGKRLIYNPGTLGPSGPLFNPEQHRVKPNQDRPPRRQKAENDNEMTKKREDPLREESLLYRAIAANC